MKNIKIIKNIFLCFLFCISFLNVSFAENIADLKVDKYVNDYANIIEDSKQLELEKDLSAYFSSTTHQIVIVTVNNMNSDYIENYSIKLAEKIKAGSEKNDNGVMLLVAKEEKKIRIEVGYGLEGVLTDASAARIINNIITPEFKNNNYTAGIVNGIQEILKYTSNENYGLDKNKEEGKSSNGLLKFLTHMPVEIFFILFFFGVSIFQWIISIFGRTKSWWLGGVVGGVFAITIVSIFGFILFSILSAAAITIFGFIFDYFISKNYKEHVAGTKSGPPDWWAGGAGLGGGSGWSSSSGGGFSGGGGGFGGGGSSGSW